MLGSFEKEIILQMPKTGLTIPKEEQIIGTDKKAFDI